MSDALPAGHTTALQLLTQLLRRAGWRDATPADPYTAAQQLHYLEPARPKRATGHTPAQLVLHAEAVGLSTYSRTGEAMERVTWAWVDPQNLQRVHDYVTAALADAIEMRGEL